MLSVKPVIRDSRLIGHEFKLRIPSFVYHFPGETVDYGFPYPKSYPGPKPKNANIAYYPPQDIQVQEQVITTFVELNEIYDHQIVKSYPSIYTVKGIEDHTEMAHVKKIVVPPETFRFWPPLFKKLQVCPDRLLDFIVLPDLERVRSMDEAYPTTNEHNLMANGPESAK